MIGNCSASSRLASTPPSGPNFRAFFPSSQVFTAKKNDKIKISQPFVEKCFFGWMDGTFLATANFRRC
jgi:Na+-transporting NADH:ubiquinone oxidoreductase subunit NqrF